MNRCECDWTWHKGWPCANEPADHGPVRTSPELCIRCLFVCEGERDDAEEALMLGTVPGEAPK